MGAPTVRSRARRRRAYAPDVVDAAIEAGVERLRRCDADRCDLVMGLESAPARYARTARADRRCGAMGDHLAAASGWVARP